VDDHALAVDVAELETGDFGDAAWAWLAQHNTYIKPNTRRVYRQYVKSLVEFLGDNMELARIDISTVRAYQKWRSESACASRTNSEVSALKMILCEASLWDRIVLLYQPLPMPKRKVRQNMSEEEERRLMAVALDKPRRRLAGHCLLIMANTTMGFGELRNVIARILIRVDDAEPEGPFRPSVDRRCTPHAPEDRASDFLAYVVHDGDRASDFSLNAGKNLQNLLHRGVVVLIRRMQSPKHIKAGELYSLGLQFGDQPCDSDFVFEQEGRRLPASVYPKPTRPVDGTALGSAIEPRQALRCEIRRVLARDQRATHTPRNAESEKGTARRTGQQQVHHDQGLSCFRLCNDYPVSALLHDVLNEPLSLRRTGIRELNRVGEHGMNPLLWLPGWRRFDPCEQVFPRMRREKIAYVRVLWKIEERDDPDAFGKPRDALSDYLRMSTTGLIVVFEDQAHLAGKVRAVCIQPLWLLPRLRGAVEIAGRGDSKIRLFGEEIERAEALAILLAFADADHVGGYDVRKVEKNAGSRRALFRVNAPLPAAAIIRSEDAKCLCLARRLVAPLLKEHLAGRTPVVVFGNRRPEIFRNSVWSRAGDFADVQLGSTAKIPNFRLCVTNLG